MPSLVTTSQASYLNPSLYVSDLHEKVAVDVRGMGDSSVQQIRTVLPWAISTHGDRGDVSVSVLGKNTYVTRNTSDDNSLNSERCIPSFGDNSLVDTVLQIDEQARHVMFRHLEKIDAEKDSPWGCPLPEVIKVDVLDRDGCKVPLFRGSTIPSIVRLTEEDNQLLRLYNKHDEPVSIAVVHWTKKDKDVDLCHFAEGKSILHLNAKDKVEVPLDLQDVSDAEGTAHYLMLIVGDEGAFNEDWTEKFVEQLQPCGVEGFDLPQLPLTKKWGLMTSPIKFTDFVGPKDYGMEELD